MRGIEYNVSPSLESILSKYKVQPSIHWVRLIPNEAPPQHHHLIMVLFNDGTVVSDFPENVDWLGSLAYAHIGY